MDLRAEVEDRIMLVLKNQMYDYWQAEKKPCFEQESNRLGQTFLYLTRGRSLVISAR